MEKIINNKYPNVVAENATISEEYKESAMQLTRDTIFEFLELCKIPHPSQYMGKMRQYLLHWCEDHSHLNISSTLDDSGCVIIDIEASEGCDEEGIEYSTYPKVILQSHMDMVASSTKEYRHCNYAGKRWNPKEDQIPAVYDRTEGIISTNNKCSLGADDGYGMATCLAIAKNPHIKHGPIRCLYTYDEEVNMQGVRNLDPNHLDAEYLINLDSIYVGTVLNSAAGGFEGQLSKQFQLVSAPHLTSMITLRMGGLTGGHSGEDIAKGRGSSTEIGVNILSSLRNMDLPFGIAKLKAGSAMNAIATTMKMILIVNEADVEAVETVMREEMKRASNTYVGGKNLDFTITVEPPFGIPTMTRQDSASVVDSMKVIPNGPIKMLWGTTPESSCNIGLWDIREGRFKINALYRTCLDKNQDHAYEMFQEIADDIEADLLIKAIFPAWSRLENNPLNDLLLESYENACGFIGESIDIHSGLECGYLSKKNPNLKMASIGCDLQNEHTPRETLYTKSMPSFMASLLYVLSNIKKLN